MSTVLYRAKVLSVFDIGDYEGTLELEICGKRIYSIYWGDSVFAERYLSTSSSIPIDLWMSFYHSKPEIVPARCPYCILYSPNSYGYKICGRVTDIFSSRSFRLDCGIFQVDIHVDEEFHSEIDTYVSVSGCFQSYFSGTKYDWANFVVPL